MMELTINRNLAGVKASGIRRFGALVRQTPGAIGLTIGEPDLDTPAEVSAAAAAALAAGQTHYPPNNGYPWLLKAIAGFEREKHGLCYDPEEIVVTVGATEAIFASLFAILNPGDEVIIPTPAFGLYESIVTLCGGRAVFLPTEDNGFQIDPAALAAAMTERTKAVILTSPNNPTGCVYTPETLEAVHALLRERAVFVLCDEVYRQLTYVEDFRSFSGFADMRDRIIVIQSFSKPYAMTGWRMGYLMADRPVKEKIQLAHQYAVVSVPAFLQKGCLAALEHDVAPERALFRRRRDEVCRRLREMGLAFREPEGAFYVFVDIRKFGMDSVAFCEKMLKEALVGVVPGAYFGTEGFFRLSYCYSDEELKTALDRMEEYVRAQSTQ